MRNLCANFRLDLVNFRWYLWIFGIWKEIRVFFWKAWKIGRSVIASKKRTQVSFCVAIHTLQAVSLCHFRKSVNFFKNSHKFTPLAWIFSCIFCLKGVFKNGKFHSLSHYGLPRKSCGFSRNDGVAWIFFIKIYKIPFQKRQNLNIFVNLTLKNLRQRLKKGRLLGLTIVDEKSIFWGAD